VRLKLKLKEAESVRHAIDELGQEYGAGESIDQARGEFRSFGDACLTLFERCEGSHLVGGFFISNRHLIVNQANLSPLGSGGEKRDDDAGQNHSEQRHGHEVHAAVDAVIDVLTWEKVL